MDEVETKLDVHPSFHLPDLSGAIADARVEDRGRQLLRATYWDTDDLRLIRAGVTVRHRRGEDDDGAWQVKLSVEGGSQDALSRRELSYEGHPSRPPTAVRSLVTTFTRGAALRPVVRLRTRRRTLAVRRDDDVAAEVVDDEVSVVTDGRIAERFRELEVELGPAGTARDRRSLVATLLAEGATQSAQQPKVVRALGAPAREPDDLDLEALSPSVSPVAERLVAAIGRVRSADPLVRRDEGGTQDLAAALAELAALTAAWEDGDAPDGLARASQALVDHGAAQLLCDLATTSGSPLGDDVQALWCSGREALATALARVRHQCRADLAEALDDPAYPADLDRLLIRARDGADTLSPRDALSKAWAQFDEAPALAADRIAAFAQMLHTAGVNTGRVIPKARHAATVARQLDCRSRAVLLLANLVEEVSGPAAFVAGHLAHGLQQELDASAKELRRAAKALDGKRLTRLRGG